MDLVSRMDSVLGLDLLNSALSALEAPVSLSSATTSDDPEAAKIDALVAERVQAKKDKNFARADEIRNELTSMGIVVTDTPDGPVWSRKA